MIRLLSQMIIMCHKREGLLECVEFYISGDHFLRIICGNYRTINETTNRFYLRDTFLHSITS